MEKEKTEQKKLGKYTTNRKFLNFIQYTKSDIRITTDNAYVQGKNLSGMLEGRKFKITICDEKTIDFEEVGPIYQDEKLIKSLINDLEEMKSTGFMNKFILRGLEFENEEGSKLYLEVEEQKPIEKLFSIFDEDPIPNKVSDKVSSLIDSLLGDSQFDNEESYSEDSSEDASEINESILDNGDTFSEKEINQSLSKSMLMDSFNSMNEMKIKELQERKEKKENELNKHQFTLKTTEKLLKDCKEEIKTINSRLDSLKPSAEPNGIAFNVSQKNKTGLEFDETTKNVVSKISEILQLKEDVVLDLITKGFYTIKFCHRNKIENPEDYFMDKETKDLLYEFDNEDSFKLVKDNEFEYRGELDWHKIVNKLIKLGFEQDSEWDKKCGSNSFESLES